MFNEYSLLLLLILPVTIIVIGFKFYVLDTAKRMDSGLFSVWIETEAINDHQIKITKAYSFNKWRVLKVIIYKTNRDYYNNL